jgi:hypothetical protein
VKLRRRPGKTYSPNGARECARRVRQAEARMRKRAERHRRMMEDAALIDSLTRSLPGVWFFHHATEKLPDWQWKVL